MKVILCVKAVPGRLVHASTTESLEINPADASALSRLVRLKEESELRITCVSMGPLSVKNVLARCLALGADHAVLLTDRCLSGADTYATAKALANVVRKMDYDFIACGDRSADGETGQVVFELAEFLDLYCVAGVTQIRLLSKDQIHVEYEENECIKAGKLSLPALLSFQDTLTRCGSVNLWSLKKAMSQEIPSWSAREILLDEKECGQSGSKTKVISTRPCAYGLERKSEELPYSVDEAAGYLIREIECFSN